MIRLASLIKLASVLVHSNATWYTRQLRSFLFQNFEMKFGNDKKVFQKFILGLLDDGFN